ncbi:Cysteine-rich RLK (RECEPTOR-like protein kinase) 8 [Theobroma cacao]|uniref:Cysteine-rich RLK (RECEPTOR-like protein kinase) 8 n=1 Tax=Theobroma cacao TaxID=3641 RepID=A0A061F2D8_THECC|nr:Cysteine-rich RLK (RECEPTOR-like protein kinase) 8 [Theobroma cacao]
MKSAFLNGVLSEDIYIEQPEGYVKEGNEGKIYKLRKALYGLQQAPRAWYERIDEHFKNQGFVKSVNEHTLYVKKSNELIVLIVDLYVDDMLITRPDKAYLEDFKTQMMNVFDMTDMGLMSYFLGMEVLQLPDQIILHQKKYAKDLLKKFDMDSCKAIDLRFTTGNKLIKEDE